MWQGAVRNVQLKKRRQTRVLSFTVEGDEEEGGERLSRMSSRLPSRMSTRGGESFPPPPSLSSAPVTTPASSSASSSSSDLSLPSPSPLPTSLLDLAPAPAPPSSLAKEKEKSSKSGNIPQPTTTTPAPSINITMSNPSSSRKIGREDKASAAESRYFAQLGIQNSDFIPPPAPVVVKPRDDRPTSVTPAPSSTSSYSTSYSSALGTDDYDQDYLSSTGETPLVPKRAKKEEKGCCDSCVIL